MPLDKLIADQMKRIKALQSELQAREAGAKDVDRPAAFKRERARALRDTLRTLKADREATIARYDAEIVARETELAAIVEKSDLDLALGQTLKNAGVKAPEKSTPSAAKRRKASEPKNKG
jgi:hypothetical protein